MTGQDSSTPGVTSLGELPATEVTATSSTVFASPVYRPPVQYRRPAPVIEDEPLILDDILPEATAETANSTFLSPTGLEVLGIREPQDVVRYAANQSATDSGSRSFGDIYSVRGLTNTIFFGAPSTKIPSRSTEDSRIAHSTI